MAPALLFRCVPAWICLIKSQTMAAEKEMGFVILCKILRLRLFLFMGFYRVCCESFVHMRDERLLRTKMYLRAPVNVRHGLIYDRTLGIESGSSLFD